MRITVHLSFGKIGKSELLSSLGASENFTRDNNTTALWEERDIKYSQEEASRAKRPRMASRELYFFNTDLPELWASRLFNEQGTQVTWRHVKKPASIKDRERR